MQATESFETMEKIDAKIEELKAELAQVRGTRAEVYSRIVGYYRSVKNWNAGKREEYRDRLLFDPESKKKAIGTAEGGADRSEQPRGADGQAQAARARGGATGEAGFSSVLLFTRKTCPNCPPAKKALSAGCAFDEVDADTTEGKTLAARYSIYSTPTALFLDDEGNEVARHTSGPAIAAFLGKAKVHA